MVNITRLTAVRYANGDRMGQTHKICVNADARQQRASVGIMVPYCYSQNLCSADGWVGLEASTNAPAHLEKCGGTVLAANTNDSERHFVRQHVVAGYRSYHIWWC